MYIQTCKEDKKDENTSIPADFDCHQRLGECPPVGPSRMLIGRGKKQTDCRYEMRTRT